MECLRSLLKDYKSELEEIFVADKHLQKELMYDTKKYENAKARVTVQEAVASIQKSGGVSRVRSPAAVYAKVAGRLGTEGEIRSAVADAAAEAVVRSVLKEKNLNVCDKATPLGSTSVPKLSTGGEGGSVGIISSRVKSDTLESMRPRQDFEYDVEN